MFIEYRGVALDCSPAAIKAWLATVDDDVEFCPQDGEACLVHDYLADRLRHHGLTPPIYVSGADMTQHDREEQFVPYIAIGEDPDAVTVEPDGPLRWVIAAFDGITAGGLVGRDRVMAQLSEQGVW